MLSYQDSWLITYLVKHLLIQEQSHLEGNTIEYTSDGVTLTLKITEADGTVTEITIPIGTFTF